jgi:hypothetical protein
LALYRYTYSFRYPCNAWRSPRDGAARPCDARVGPMVPRPPGVAVSLIRVSVNHS